MLVVNLVYSQKASQLDTFMHFSSNRCGEAGIKVGLVSSAPFLTDSLTLSSRHNSKHLPLERRRPVKLWVLVLYS
jgi:hypothetical protein